MEKQVCAPLVGASHLGDLKNENKKKFYLAFSLIELMISLIVISLIAAAFVPVITKKLARFSIVAGSFGGNSSGGVSEKCSNIGENCALCAGDTCLSCKNKCGTGEVLNSKNCKCEDTVPYYIKINKLLVTRFNMGDHKDTAIPKAAGVTIVKAGESCGSEYDYGPSCCWQGTTAANCDDTNGSYSGCNRTVCNWKAANAICANYNKDGKTWRLPTTDEMLIWGSNTIDKGNDGLLLCDEGKGYKSAFCSTGSCPGSTYGGCYVNKLWSSNTWTEDKGWLQNPRYNYFGVYYKLVNGEWQKSDALQPFAFSFRCVTEADSNCTAFSGDTCTACKSGYYLKNDECKKYTTVPNCKAYASAEDKCEACEDGYYLSNNECKKSTEVQNCESYSKTENKCETCKNGYILNGDKCEVDSNYYLNINGLLVTKYNMGDNFYTKIPSTAGVTIATTYGSCGTSTNYSAKCCWQGVTSGYSCDSANGDYSGCNRTVCNWAAANAICAKYSQDGRTWRLPTTSEMSNWLDYSKGLETNGLMLCDFSSKKSSSYCNYSGSCKGALSNGCYPASVWSGSILNSTMAYSYELNMANLKGPNGSYNTYGFSVRCVSEQIQNCAIYSGNTCSSCKTGYYSSNGKCIARPTISNCASYSGASCAYCNSGYYLSGGYCYEHSHIANCASMSTTSDTCLSCYSGYYLYAGTCHAHTTVENCTQYSATSDQCTSCNTGYRLKNNSCFYEPWMPI